MKETKELGTKPIGLLLARFSIPAVIAMLVNAIYNVVDRIFIAKLVGEDALGGLTIVFPIMMMLFAFAGLIGAGGAALLAIRLGEKDYKGGSHVFGNTVTYGLIMTVIILSTLSINLDAILSFFGAKGAIFSYGHDYMRIILVGFIFQMFGFIFSNFVRTEGKPILSMVAMLVSALTNIVLDYVFIGIVGMGVKGAALATIIGQLVGLLIYLNYYFKGRSNIRIHKEDFIPDFRLLVKIVVIGFATFISTIGTSVAMTFINKKLLIYGGDPAVTSMGAINSLFTFFIMPIMGITQGIVPIIGYNHGAKQMHRVYKTLKLSIMVTIAFSVIVFVMMELFAPTFVLLFLKKGSDTIPIAANGLRIFIIMLPILSINLVGTSFFQAIAMGKTSVFLGLLRQFIFLLPALFILPGFFGINGVWMSTPIADGLSVLVTVIVLLVKYINDRRELNLVTPAK